MGAGARTGQPHITITGNVKNHHSNWVKWESHTPWELYNTNSCVDGRAQSDHIQFDRAVISLERTRSLKAAASRPGKWRAGQEFTGEETISEQSITCLTGLP